MQNVIFSLLSIALYYKSKTPLRQLADAVFLIGCGSTILFAQVGLLTANAEARKNLNSRTVRRCPVKIDFVDLYPRNLITFYSHLE